MSEIKEIKFDAVLPFRDLALTQRNMRWNSSMAFSQVRGFTDSFSMPSSQFAQAFLWADDENRDEFKAYKLLIADVINGELKAVPKAIFNIATSLGAIQVNLDVPPADIPGLRRIVSRYYAKMRRQFNAPELIPPWEAQGS